MTENIGGKIIIDQKCPNCGHTIKFDPSDQDITCDACGSSFAAESIGDDSCLFGEKHVWGDDDAALYHCPSCGGDLIFGKNDVVTTCKYCGNNLILGDRLTGDRRPNRIIPFKFNKKTAEQQLRKYLDRYSNRNKTFCTNPKIKSLEGLYIPMWTYSTKMFGKATVNCYTKDENGKTTAEYAGRTRRGGCAVYWNVPVDGSAKMPDDLMESIEPFKFKESVPFDSSYLLGFAAQKYDVDEHTCYRRAKQRMSNHLLTLLKKDVTKFDKIDTLDMIASAPITFVNYFMVPVWIATLEWEGKIYTFAINGQTGRVRGNIPEKKNHIKNKKIMYLSLMHIPSLILLLIAILLNLNIPIFVLIIAALELPIIYLYKRIKWSVEKDRTLVKLKYGAEIYYEPNSLNIMFRDRQYQK